MVGVYYSTRPFPVPAGLCPNCRDSMLQGNKLRRTAHICGIPVLPLKSDHHVVCWKCHYFARLHTGRNCYYPGRRNPGSWLTHGHWGKGRSGMWDRRESYTYRFAPRHRRWWW